MDTKPKSVSNENVDEEKIRSLSVSSTAGGEVTRLSPGSPNLDAEIAQSINSVNVCGSALLDGMRNFDMKDVGHVMSACDVAKAVVSLARVKMDLVREIKNRK